jgi:hypothetical protein
VVEQLVEARVLHDLQYDFLNIIENIKKFVYLLLLRGTCHGSGSPGFLCSSLV